MIIRREYLVRGSVGTIRSERVDFYLFGFILVYRTERIR